MRKTRNGDLLLEFDTQANVASLKNVIERIIELRGIDPITENKNLI